VIDHYSKTISEWLIEYGWLKIKFVVKPPGIVNNNITAVNIDLPPRTARSGRYEQVAPIPLKRGDRGRVARCSYLQGAKKSEKINGFYLIRKVWHIWLAAVDAYMFFHGGSSPGNN